MIFDYEARVESALRHVVKQVLEDTAREGLADPHHFYITFQTHYPGVNLPDSVRRAHPEDITIVLQHQFWDLDVQDSGFSVVLTFQDIPKTIFVPFDALLAFNDPSVRFGLHFTPPDDSENCHRDEPDSGPEKAEKKGHVISLDTFRKDKR
jgi:hypothetical protein